MTLTRQILVTIIVTGVAAALVITGLALFEWHDTRAGPGKSF